MHLIRILSLVFLVFAAVERAQSQEPPSPMRVSTQFDKIYAPEGFDDNDHIQISGTGIYPNTCYRNAETLVVVDEERKTINLEPMAYYYTAICLQVLLPYERVVDIGLLKAGKYSIFQNNGRERLGELRVGHALNAGPDDEVYAPVSQVFVQSKNGRSRVFVTGDLPNNCMQIKELRLDLQKNVVVIRPIVKMVSAQNCKDGKFHFEISKDLKAQSGRYLIHVRSMNGKAVNSLVEVL